MSAEWVRRVGERLLARSLVDRRALARCAAELALDVVPMLQPPDARATVRAALATAERTAMSRGEAQRAAAAVFEAGQSAYARGFRGEYGVGNVQRFEACAEACWVAGMMLDTSASQAFDSALDWLAVSLGEEAVRTKLREHVDAVVVEGLRRLAERLDRNAIGASRGDDTCGEGTKDHSEPGSQPVAALGAQRRRTARRVPYRPDRWWDGAVQRAAL